MIDEKELKAPKEVNVGGGTNARNCASSVHQRIREGYTNLRLCAVGLSAVSQAVKTVLELNKKLAGTGRTASIVPYMEDRKIRNSNLDSKTTVTIMRLVLLES